MYGNDFLPFSIYMNTARNALNDQGVEYFLHSGQQELTSAPLV